MNKDVKVMLKEAGILFAITLIAGLFLGVVNELTKDRIAEQKAQAIADACKMVFNDADSVPEYVYTPDEELTFRISETGVQIGKVYEAKGSAGETLGYVIESASKEGYGGTIDIYVGIRNDGIINAVSILEISETVGLGMRAEEVLVPQFAGKGSADFTYTKSGAASPSEIDAIAGATITTRAFVNAVNGAVLTAEALTEGGVSNE